MADRELHIKYLLDKTQAESQARQFHRDEQGRFKALTAATQDQTKALEGGASAAINMGQAMLGMLGMQAGLGAINQVIGAINSSMQEAAEYTKKVADAFGATRSAMREIAAIQGKGLTNDFTGEQLGVIGQAKTVGVEEGIEGIKAFQQFGSGYVGDGKDSRVTQDKVNRMLPMVMATAKRTGMGQKPAMQMFASVIQSMPKGSTEKEYMDTFAKMVAESLDSKGSATVTASNVAPVLAEYAGEGGAFGDTTEGLLTATRWVNTLSETNPGQAGMLARNVMKEFDTDELKGKNDELGIEEGMTPDQKLKAMRDKFRAETGGKGSFAMWYSKKVGRVGNMRSLRGLDVLIRKGMEGGFFDRMENKAAAASMETLEADNEKHLATQGGEADRVAASTGIAERMEGREYAGVDAAKARAKEELTKEGAFKTWRFSDVLRTVGSGSVENQLINERALEDLRNDAKSKGVDTAPKFGEFAAPVGIGSSEFALREEMKRVADLIAAGNAQRSRQVPAVPPPMNGRPNVPAQMPR